MKQNLQLNDLLIIPIVFHLISVQEGAFLYKNNVNPYSGDLYHENPLILYASNFLIQSAGKFIPYLFVACDLFCAFLLYRMAKELIPQMVSINGTFATFLDPIKLN